MTDIIKQADDLECQARLHDAAFQREMQYAQEKRAQAAELRRQAAERPALANCYVLVSKSGIVGGRTYSSPEDAEEYDKHALEPRRVAHVRELRPVRVTDEHIAALLRKWQTDGPITRRGNVIDFAHYVIREICGLDVES